MLSLRVLLLLLLELLILLQLFVADGDLLLFFVPCKVFTVSWLNVILFIVC